LINNNNVIKLKPHTFPIKEIAINSFTAIVEFMVTKTVTSNPVPLKRRNPVRLWENIPSQRRI